jgi:hypothetical protein
MNHVLIINLPHNKKQSHPRPSQLPLPKPTVITLLHRQRLHIPNHLRILINTSITTKEPHPRHTQNRLRDPLVLVLVRLVHKRLSLDIAVEVIRDEVVVSVVFDGAGQGTERACVAEGAGLDRLEDFEEVWVEGVGAVVVGVAEVFDVFGEVPEEEDVVLSDLAGDFDLLLLVQFRTRKEPNLR